MALCYTYLILSGYQFWRFRYYPKYSNSAMMHAISWWTFGTFDILWDRMPMSKLLKVTASKRLLYPNSMAYMNYFVPTIRLCRPILGLSDSFIVQISAEKIWQQKFMVLDIRSIWKTHSICFRSYKFSKCPFVVMKKCVAVLSLTWFLNADLTDV